MKSRSVLPEGRGELNGGAALARGLEAGVGSGAMALVLGAKVPRVAWALCHLGCPCLQPRGGGGDGEGQ